jgi:hypothetical protein
MDPVSTNQITYSADSPAVVAFMQAVQDNRNLAVSKDWRANGWEVRIVATDRRKYIAVDEADAFEGELQDHHRGGRFLVDRATGVVYTIEGYGKRGRACGTLEGLTVDFTLASATYNPEARSHVVAGKKLIATWKGGAK